MFEVNHCFEIGSTHLICQDYALSGQIQTDEALFTYGIISDGCSGSKDTDIGSRYLAMATRRILKSELANKVDIFNISVGELGDKIIKEASGYIDSELLIENNSFDATLGFFITDGEKYRIIMYGDGLVYLETDVRKIYHISYVENTPPYLSYKLDANRLWGYSGKIGCTDKAVNIWNVNDSKSPALESQIINKIVDSPYTEICGLVNNVQKIAIFSDGIDSFESYNQSVARIDFLKCTEQYINYPIKKGDFLIRNFKHNSKDNLKNFVRHYDDLSCAAMVRS